jgi:hypothetical protein
VSLCDEPAPQHQWLLDLRPFSASLASFRFRTSGVAAGVVTQLTAVAIGIRPTRLADRPPQVRLAGALSLRPMIIVGLLGGTTADVFDRRKVLIAAVDPSQSLNEFL